MNTVSGDPVKLPKSQGPTKADSRGPLQARFSAAHHAEEETEETTASAHHEEPVVKTSSKPPQAMEEEAQGQSDLHAFEALNGSLGSLPTPRLAQDLRQLADSLSRLADQIERLDLLMHVGETNEPRPSPVSGPLSQLVKGRPELQQLLREYLFR
jgi:hypothetical protein